MRHRTVGIVFDRLFETDDRLLVIVAVQPDQAAVEPGQRLGG